MKHWMPVAAGTAAISVLLLGRVNAESPPAGQVDFGTFSPPHSGGEFVEVKISSNLIGLAAGLLEKQEPQIAEVLNGIKLVHVNVIAMDDENRADLEQRSEKIRKQLEGKGWERVVTAQKEGEDVGVYIKTRNKDTVEGVAITVMEGKRQAVFVNIVGDIKPSQLAMVGERLHIDPLKKISEEIQPAK
jgi:uncharacterized protein DUF4252